MYDFNGWAVNIKMSLGRMFTNDGMLVIASLLLLISIESSESADSSKTSYRASLSYWAFLYAHHTLHQHNLMSVIPPPFKYWNGYALLEVNNSSQIRKPCSLRLWVMKAVLVDVHGADHVFELYVFFRAKTLRAWGTAVQRHREEWKVSTTI